jgi:hypothetical protein
MAEQTEAIFVSIPPQEVLMRLSKVIAGERQALLHPFATKAAYMGTIYNNGFHILPKGEFRGGRTRCNGIVDWIGNASRISISFTGSSFVPAFLIIIAIIFSVVAVAASSVAVFLGGAPAYALVLAIVGSLLLIVIMIGIGWIVKSVASSKQQGMINFLERVFQDVR